MIPDQEFLTVDQVLKQIAASVSSQTPFSLARVGDGENLVMAQDSVWTIEKVLSEKWARKANAGEKGVTLPNLILRDQMVSALRQADIVGIPFEHNDPIRTADYRKRSLTDKLFAYYRIRPKSICHTFVNRVLPQKEEFWRILKKKKIMVLSQWAGEFGELLQGKPYNLTVSLAVPFSHFEQLPKTLQVIKQNRKDFDVSLISCGVNAVVLAVETAAISGKIGLDFGKSAAYMIRGVAGLGKSSRAANLDLIP